MKFGNLKHSFKILFCITMLIAICAIPVSVANGSSENTIKAQAGILNLALLAPMTGGASFIGVPGSQGVQMAVDEWNAAGGVLGKTIQLAIEDTQCNGALAVTAANRVIDQDGVKYIIGEYCSSASIPVSEIAEAKGVVQISPTATNSGVTQNLDGTVKQYVFRACFIDPFQGTMMARFAVAQNYRRGFILHDDNNQYSVDLAALFQTSFTSAGGIVVGNQSYDASALNFDALFTAIKNSQAEVVYLPDFYPFIDSFILQARASGITAVFMGTDAWNGGSFSANLSGAYFSDHFSLSDPRPIVQPWSQAYHTKYGADPDGFAALSYDATNLLLNAIKNAGIDDPAIVKNYLARLQYNGVTGDITFDQLHNPYKPIVINRITNGVASFFANYAPFGSIAGHVLKADGTSVIQDQVITVEAWDVPGGTDIRETYVAQSNGSYTIGGLAPGRYKLLANSKNMPGYVSKYYTNKLNLDLANEITVTANQTLTGIDFRLESPISSEINPTDVNPASLEYNPPSGLDTEVSIPPDAVTDPTTIVLEPASANHSAGFLFAGTAFNLNAFQGGILQQGFTFSNPIYITLHYIDQPLDENLITLRYWNATSHTWEDALCPGLAYDRDLANNTITVPVCHLSSFGLFQQGYHVYLSMLKR